MVCSERMMGKTWDKSSDHPRPVKDETATRQVGRLSSSRAARYYGSCWGSRDGWIAKHRRWARNSAVHFQLDGATLQRSKARYCDPLHTLADPACDDLAR